MFSAIKKLSYISWYVYFLLTPVKISHLARISCFCVPLGGSSIVKVPGDVPPARVCFFKPSSLAKGILFANFHSFSLGKGILFRNFGQRNVKLR